MTDQLGTGQRWIFCIVALCLWLAWGWPMERAYLSGTTIRDVQISALWFAPFAIFGASVFLAMGFRLRPTLLWSLLLIQVAMVAAMALVVPWAGISSFLVIVAFQAALATSSARALGWLAFQNLALVGALAQDLNLDICWVIAESVCLQLLLVFTAQVLRTQTVLSRALAQTVSELRSAQAVIAKSVRDAERVRISRELHDAWGHELTALGLQLEIASHVNDADRTRTHVSQARALAKALLSKVRDVVSALREAERCDLKEALEAMARTVPTPTIHLDISPALDVSPDQAHALVRCAQEAITNAVKHADAANLWLQVVCDGNGVRLVARNDGAARVAASPAGNGLLGMRERVEQLGGRLSVDPDLSAGFTVSAWLPSHKPSFA